MLLFVLIKISQIKTIALVTFFALK